MDPLVNGDKVLVYFGSIEKTPRKIYTNGAIDIIEVLVPSDIYSGTIRVNIPGRGSCKGDVSIATIGDTSSSNINYNIPYWIKQWSHPFGQPKGIAFSSPYFYVSDTEKHCINKFEIAGDGTISYLGKLGGPGMGDGQFNSPHSLVAYATKLYVADTANNRIQRWNSVSDSFEGWFGKDQNGNFGWYVAGLSNTPTSGNENGAFDSPYGVTVDESGNIYVADTSNNRVQKFSDTGNPAYSTQWGTSGPAIGQFNCPYGIFQLAGLVYVADTSNQRLQASDTSGSSQIEWSESGTGDGQVGTPTSIIADGSGNIYVIEQDNHRISKWGGENTFEGWFGKDNLNNVCWHNPGENASPTNGTEDGAFNSPYGLIMDGSSNIYVTDTNNKRIEKFSFASSPPTHEKTLYNTPHGIVRGSGNNLYVTDIGLNCVEKFDSDGNFIQSFGKYGTGDGQFNQPQGIDVDSGGNIYVADTSNHRIQKWTSTLTFEGWLGKGSTSGWHIYPSGQNSVAGAGNSEFNSPKGVALDSGGNVYVTDSMNNRIQKFNSSMIYQTQWGVAGTGDGEFSLPEGIKIDSSGNVYVSDSNNHRIQKFNSSGTFITKWGTSGTGTGQFNTPQHITIDSNNYIYVADKFNNRIQKFDSNGKFILTWGYLGINAGQFTETHGIAIDSTGAIYVVDNCRIQKFNVSL